MVRINYPLHKFDILLSTKEGMLQAKKKHGSAFHVIMGSVFGDGHIQANEAASKNPRDLTLLKTARFREAHSPDEELYLRDKHRLLKSFMTGAKCENGPYLADKDTVYSMYSLRMPAFVPYYRYFYINKVKTIPNDIDLFFTDPITLAIWYLDDGTKRNYNSCRICASGFPGDQVELLRQCLVKNFSLDSEVESWYKSTKTPDGRGYGLVFHSERDRYIKFAELIKPLVEKHFPSMSHKVQINYSTKTFV